MTIHKYTYHLLFLFFFLLSTAPLGASAQSEAKLQNPPTSSAKKTYFPPPDSEGGWRRATSAAKMRRVAGMDKQKLDKAFNFIEKSTKNGGLLVVRHGWLVYENYFGKGSRNAAPNLGSIGKSFTSISVGILMAQHPKLFPHGLDQKIFTPTYFPAKAFPLTDPAKAKIKLGQLLAMTAGIRGNNPVYVRGGKRTIDPPGPDGWRASVDAIALGKKKAHYRRPLPGLKPTRVSHTYSTRTLWTAPGGGYSYATSSAHLASMIVRHISGMELRRYVGIHLAKPLGWGRWGWGGQEAHLKHTTGGGGIAVRGTDMLRFGYLLLHKGRWRGQQIVPASYVRKATQRSPYDPYYPYSLGFNVNTGGHYPELPRHGVPHDAFLKVGAGGHVLYVIPSLDLVVLKLGGWDFQYSPRNTGFPEPSESAVERESRKNWAQTVDLMTGVRKTIELVVKAIEPSGKNRK